MEIYIAIAVIAVLALWIVGIYNSFISLRNSVEEAFSTMDVFLKKRYDLIPNLVETVKGYAAHESGTLEKVIKARNMAMSATGTEEKLAAENALSGTLKSLFALSENYPDLKANANFLDLQNQVKVVEEDIATSRRFYNGVVKSYNIKCESVPSNIVAGIFGFKRKPLFEIDTEQRENVKIQF